MKVLDPRTKFLYYIGKLFNFAEQQGTELICFTFYRSPSQQYQEFLKGKSKIKSNGPHQKWLAMDLVMIENGEALFDSSKETIDKYQILGNYWKSIDNDCMWGGDFTFTKDVYHFELKAVLMKSLY